MCLVWQNLPSPHHVLLGDYMDSRTWMMTAVVIAALAWIAREVIIVRKLSICSVDGCSRKGKFVAFGTRFEEGKSVKVTRIVCDKKVCEVKVRVEEKTPELELALIVDPQAPDRII